MLETNISKMIDDAPIFVPELPLPLFRASDEPAPFPVDALGPILAAAAIAIEDKIQAPIELCAQSVLAVASLAVQANVDVILPTGQTRPTSCYYVSIAASGERKSACDHEALAPVREREEELRRAHKTEKLAYKNANDTYE
ncbi:MAG: DUF3987 domain-containing protein, partial [Dongiaceae bacterium]